MKNASKNDIFKKIKPLADHVLVKEDAESKEKKTLGGIIIPVTVNEDKGAKTGEVMAVGPGRTEEGELVKPSVKYGDKVLFKEWGGSKIKLDDEEYYIISESDILAIIA
ncbi:MAG: co-chaperone GroES [Patescibacteria group bacterium]|nr:co-chaperone GroES [Patescibacteria group bacterium]